MRKLSIALTAIFSMVVLAAEARVALGLDAILVLRNSTAEMSQAARFLELGLLQSSAETRVYRMATKAWSQKNALDSTAHVLAGNFRARHPLALVVRPVVNEQGKISTLLMDVVIPQADEAKVAPRVLEKFNELGFSMSQSSFRPALDHLLHHREFKRLTISVDLEKTTERAVLDLSKNLSNFLGQL